MKIWNISNVDYFYKHVLKNNSNTVNNMLKEKEKYYNNYFDMPKKNGFRRIYSLDKKSLIYKLQNNVYKNFLSNIVTSDNSYGFKKSYNYINYLEPHVSYLKNKYYLRMDLNNFFNSISYDLIKKVMSNYFIISEELNEEKKEELLCVLMEIITYKKKLVQGLCTSPSISNIVFRQLDIRIYKYCEKLDITYTRYADDMLFSSYTAKIHRKIFYNGICKILSSKGFTVNHNKTLRFNNFISLNGIIVSDDISISRKKFRFINSLIYFFNNVNIIDASYIEKLNNYLKDNKFYDKSFSTVPQLESYLTGYRAFLIMILKYTNDIKNINKLVKVIKNIEIILDKIKL